MAKVGDIVRFLNTTGGGRIARIDGQIAYVEDDGFDVPVLIKECVVVTPAGSKAMADSLPSPEKGASRHAEAAPTATASSGPKAEDAYRETPEGERLNVEIAFSANDLKQLSRTSYDVFLVNDSNYSLFVTFLSRGDDQRGWTTRYAGLIDPGMQEFLCEVKNEDLCVMDRVAVQYIAFKEGREFDLKTVACVEQRLDTTKFFKLHCFVPDPYFDEPVIALPIVRNDLPCRPQARVDAKALERAMAEKKIADRRKAKPVGRKATQAVADDPLVVDLHIEELVDYKAGLSNADMLNLQIDKFREVMDANLGNHGKKIVFIHGKGEGVLRQALLKELNYRYKGCEAQDASFREYGFGATQIKMK